MLCSPRTRQSLRIDGEALVSVDGSERYPMSSSGIPQFATEFLSDAGRDMSVDDVNMPGGIQHVPDRVKLFGQIGRILKPGGNFCFCVPVYDFLIWRALHHRPARIATFRAAGHRGCATRREELTQWPIQAGGT